MKVTHKRGSNSMSFVFNERREDTKLSKLIAYRGSTLKTLIYRRPTKPKFVVITMKFGYSKSFIRKFEELHDQELREYYYTSEVFPNDLKITPVELLNFTRITIDQKRQKQISSDGYIHPLKEINFKFIY